MLRFPEIVKVDDAVVVAPALSRPDTFPDVMIKSPPMFQTTV
jgi:hypothetical protein